MPIFTFSFLQLLFHINISVTISLLLYQQTHLVRRHTTRYSIMIVPFYLRRDIEINNTYGTFFVSEVVIFKYTINGKRIIGRCESVEIQQERLANGYADWCCTNRREQKKMMFHKLFKEIHKVGLNNVQMEVLDVLTYHLLLADEDVDENGLVENAATIRKIETFAVESEKRVKEEMSRQILEHNSIANGFNKKSELTKTAAAAYDYFLALYS